MINLLQDQITVIKAVLVTTSHCSLQAKNLRYPLVSLEHETEIRPRYHSESLCSSLIHERLSYKCDSLDRIYQGT